MVPGPSTGVQADDGKIYFSCHGFGLYAFLYWSADYGATWTHSEVVGPDDDGHPYLCQLLAATRPVRVQTK